MSRVLTSILPSLRLGRPLVCFAAVCLSVVIAAGKGDAEPRYVAAGALKAPDAGWDYAAVDPQARRLYLGRFGGVLTVDLRSGAVTPVLVKSALVHGVAPLPLGMAAASNGMDDTVTIFDGKTGAVHSTTHVGKGPDSIAYDPASKAIVVTDEDGEAISLVDAGRGGLLGSIPLRGSPEAVVPDGHGKLFDNIDNRAEVAIIDEAARSVTGRIKLPHCDRPTGIAYDGVRKLVVSACRNGAVLVIDPARAIVTRELKVGAGPDAVMIDPRRGVAFVPSGGTGELNVIALASGGGARVAQVLPTQAGVRTGAVDLESGAVYLPAAVLLPSHSPEAPHQLAPGSFRILIFRPQ